MKLSESFLEFVALVEILSASGLDFQKFQILSVPLVITAGTVAASSLSPS